MGAGCSEGVTEGRSHTTFPAWIGQRPHVLLGFVEMDAASLVASCRDVRAIRSDAEMHVELGPLLGVG